MPTVMDLARHESDEKNATNRHNREKPRAFLNSPTSAISAGFYMVVGAEALVKRGTATVAMAA